MAFIDIWHYRFGRSSFYVYSLDTMKLLASSQALHAKKAAA